MSATLVDPKGMTLWRWTVAEVVARTRAMDAAWDALDELQTKAEFDARLAVYHGHCDFLDAMEVVGVHLHHGHEVFKMPNAAGSFKWECRTCLNIINDPSRKRRRRDGS